MGATTYYLHQFYNASWQMLEMRSTTTQNAQPESCWVAFQYVWSKCLSVKAGPRDTGRDGTFRSPDEQDWVLVFKAEN